MIRIGEYLGFKSSKEDWNLYKLEDDVLLKMKLVLIKVILREIDENGNPGYETNHQVVIGIIPPLIALGKPADRIYSPKEIMDSITINDVKIAEVIHEDWNEYLLDDTARLSIKLVLTQVSKTNLFDQKGEPIYNIQHQTILKGNVPLDLRHAYQKRYEQVLKGLPP
ncbi:MAG: hypothetical protein ABSB28_08940 [Candidatus Bathyarchaeia archaeon]